MEIVYKALNKDMTCTKGHGVFHYPVGEWIEEEQADVAHCGLHAAIDPLDCLSYYPNIDDAVYYLALAAGDISEDGVGSRIACTKMKLVKQLDLNHLVAHSVKYIIEHPYLPCRSSYVEKDTGSVKNKFMIVRGKSPIGQGKEGQIIVLLKEKPDSPEIEDYAMYTVDNEFIKADTWYGMNGKEEYV